MEYPERMKHSSAAQSLSWPMRAEDGAPWPREPFLNCSVEEAPSLSPFQPAFWEKNIPGSAFADTGAHPPEVLVSVRNTLPHTWDNVEVPSQGRI